MKDDKTSTEKKKVKDSLDKLVTEKKERDKRYKKREPKREIIKDDLLNQLHERNILETHFSDLVNDYMAMWDIKSELIEDIQNKGVSVLYQNGANQFGYKKNDSVPELNRVNGQMLTILRELGLKAVRVVIEDEDNKFDL